MERYRRCIYLRQISLPLQLVQQPSLSLVDLGKQLLECARNGETEEVRQLMTSGAPFTTDWLRMTPLHWAVERGHLEVIKCLLKWGADMNATNKFEKTPLDIALDNDYVEVVRVLQAWPRKIPGILKSRGLGETSAVAIQVSLPSSATKTTLSSNEAVQWLETHGITMLPADNSTIVASALEGGQTISLTGDTCRYHLSLQLIPSLWAISLVLNAARQTIAFFFLALQKVIAIVTDQSQIPSLVTAGAGQSPFVVVSGATLKAADGSASHMIIKNPMEPPIKRVKRVSIPDKVNGKSGSCTHCCDRISGKCEMREC
ncbi:hypothetical protein HPB51_014759 [Rhipicephalus microplus]|uniref:Uncharacterized protein n=1 Tax=Rhipicephalus microplus TaxID=6941 RepID=A0A9J6DNB8_RHIMP|nr:hypothetical protein HPB51_014759 [Rhipicephalus microplus]